MSPDHGRVGQGDAPGRGRPGVGVAVAVRRGGEILIIRRGKDPGYGVWSLPGGSQEFGERLFETAVREVREETGIQIRPIRVLTAIDALTSGSDGGLLYHFTIVEVFAEWVAGEPSAGDDALEARWATFSEAETLVHWAETKAAIRAVAREPRADA